MQKVPPTPKGFRDTDPTLAKKRRQIINQIAAILEENNFEPLETPTLEFAETLKGKYGEEEKLIYEFEDRGGRQLALRYDLTVPLARYIASNQHLLNPTFSRYQVGQVFRGENPQHGRYREFTQFDFDTVGPYKLEGNKTNSADLEEDARIIVTAIKAIRKIGFDKATILINDRQNFQGLPTEVIRAIDKLHKIGEEGIKKELAKKGLARADIKNHLHRIKNSKPTDTIYKIIKTLKEKYSLQENKDFMFDQTLARGLDYYTGSIFEMKPTEDPSDLTIGSGGRYDNLIGMFTKKSVPAVGFSFGIDRIIELV